MADPHHQINRCGNCASLRWSTGDLTWEPRSSFVDDDGIENDIFKDFNDQHPHKNTKKSTTTTNKQKKRKQSSQGSKAAKKHKTQ